MQTWYLEKLKGWKITLQNVKQNKNKLYYKIRKETGQSISATENVSAETVINAESGNKVHEIGEKNR